MRILLVEDEVKIANATKRALELQTYAVDVVHNGKDGLDMAIGEEFDLIILDVMLPGMTGTEVCRRIRSQKITTPVMMLTAKGQIIDKVEGLDNGADDYIVKPFSFEELFARIRALIRRPKELEESILSIKDLTLDPIKKKVKRAEKTVTLSLREYALLEYLMRNKNIIVTKDQIISHVWNYDADVLPNVVEVHIKHLRDKIDTPFDVQLIKTIRGFGYEISDEE